MAGPTAMNDTGMNDRVERNVLTDAAYKELTDAMCKHLVWDANVRKARIEDIKWSKDVCKPCVQFLDKRNAIAVVPSPRPLSSYILHNA